MRPLASLSIFLLLSVPASAQEITQHRMVIESGRPVAQLRDCILAHAPGAGIVHGRGAFAQLLYGVSPERGPDASWQMRIVRAGRGSRITVQTSSRSSRDQARNAIQ